MPTATGHTQAIAASRVKNTNVYNTGGEKIGRVEDVVLDKLSNNIMFAVIGFGGFLGMGEKYHPIPWSLLDYDKQKGDISFLCRRTFWRRRRPTAWMS
jgi:sporulation protein YlmC with PRC-barrel domain